MGKQSRRICFLHKVDSFSACCCFGMCLMIHCRTHALRHAALLLGYITMVGGGAERIFSFEKCLLGNRLWICCFVRCVLVNSRCIMYIISNKGIFHLEHLNWGNSENCTKPARSQGFALLSGILPTLRVFAWDKEINIFLLTLIKTNLLTNESVRTIVNIS